jgi:hypothetical protein
VAGPPLWGWPGRPQPPRVAHGHPQWPGVARGHWGPFYWRHVSLTWHLTESVKNFNRIWRQGSNCNYCIPQIPPIRVDNSGLRAGFVSTRPTRLHNRVRHEPGPIINRVENSNPNTAHELIELPGHDPGNPLWRRRRKKNPKKEETVAASMNPEPHKCPILRRQLQITKLYK